MAIRLIIDSASDIPYKKAKENGWLFLPITVTFGEQEYRDGIDLDAVSFFDKLIETDIMPTTSQIPPSDYLDAINSVVDNGDTPVIITLSSKLSGTYQSACIAAQMAKGKTYVVDSLNATLGEAILIEYADKLIRNGMGAEELVEELEAKRSKIHLLGLLDTLEYLKRGGRISQAVALAGSLLSIKPVVGVEDGEIKLVGKARGSKNGNNLLDELISKCGSVDFNMPFTLAYSGTDMTLLNKYIEDSKHFWENGAQILPVLNIGATIGTHVGPGAIAVAFFEGHD